MEIKEGGEIWTMCVGKCLMRGSHWEKQNKTKTKTLFASFPGINTPTLVDFSMTPTKAEVEHSQLS